jgi:hypothetical protein
MLDMERGSKAPDSDEQILALFNTINSYPDGLNPEFIVILKRDHSNQAKMQINLLIILESCNLIELENGLLKLTTAGREFRAVLLRKPGSLRTWRDDDSVSIKELVLLGRW